MEAVNGSLASWARQTASASPSAQDVIEMCSSGNTPSLEECLAALDAEDRNMDIRPSETPGCAILSPFLLSIRTGFFLGFCPPPQVA